jgi:hypothetical protein
VCCPVHRAVQIAEHALLQVQTACVFVMLWSACFDHGLRHSVGVLRSMYMYLYSTSHHPDSQRCGSELYMYQQLSCTS